MARARQCCARRGARGRPQRHRPRLPRRRRAQPGLGRQAEAGGRWIAALPENERPEVIISSPCSRLARPPGDLQCRSLVGGPAKSIIDERLREREFGVFDGSLTRQGHPRAISPRPSTAAASGKFYHRAPGGESWADVILPASKRTQHHQSSLCRRARAGRLQLVVLCMRYVWRSWTRRRSPAIDKQADILNCGICTWCRGRRRRCPASPGARHEHGRTHGRRRHAADRRARADDRHAMSRCQALTRAELKRHAAADHGRRQELA